MPETDTTTETANLERVKFLRNVVAGNVTHLDGRDRVRYPDGGGYWAGKQVRAELAAKPAATIFLGHSGVYRLTAFGEALLLRADKARAERNAAVGRG